MAASPSTRWCPDCSDVTSFEALPCLDGHGEDCPEIVCVDCGCALLLGVDLDQEQHLAVAA